MRSGEKKSSLLLKVFSDGFFLEDLGNSQKVLVALRFCFIHFSYSLGSQVREAHKAKSGSNDLCLSSGFKEPIFWFVRRFSAKVDLEA